MAKSKKWYLAMREGTPWNKGMKMSDEHCQKLKDAWTKERKEKVSKSMTGKKLSKKHKQSLREAKLGKTGKLANNWLGGVSKQDRLERGRFRREIQKLVFERDDYTCQMCDERGEKIQVDHIQPWSDYVELRFDINNCRTLCMDCHYFITFGKKKPENIVAWGHNLKEVINV